MNVNVREAARSNNSTEAQYHIPIRNGQLDPLLPAPLAQHVFDPEEWRRVTREVGYATLPAVMLNKVYTALHWMTALGVLVGLFTAARGLWTAPNQSSVDHMDSHNFVLGVAIFVSVVFYWGCCTCAMNVGRHCFGLERYTERRLHRTLANVSRQHAITARLLCDGSAWAVFELSRHGRYLVPVDYVLEFSDGGLDDSEQHNNNTTQYRLVADDGEIPAV
eukprot:scaffold46343_cov298-Amphora_coffeaeformis.AAC.1